MPREKKISKKSKQEEQDWIDLCSEHGIKPPLSNKGCRELNIPERKVMSAVLRILSEKRHTPDQINDRGQGVYQIPMNKILLYYDSDKTWKSDQEGLFVGKSEIIR